MRLRTRIASVALLAAVFGGCARVNLEFPNLPSAEAMGSIRPGVTTRAEVVRRLGPPEEMRQPVLFASVRPDSPQARRVLEARDLFSRDAYTYSSTHRDIDAVGLLPIGPSLFSIAWVRSAENRWRIEFDENDVVRSVSHVDERARR